MSATPTVFRWLLASNLVLVLMASFVDVAFPSLIPGVLSDAQTKLAEADTVSENLTWWVALGVAGLILLGLVVASYVGLYRFRLWGRRLAVLTTLMAIPFHFPAGPVVQSALSALLLEASMISWGAILAMAYFSPLKTRFETPANSAVQSTPASGRG